MSSPARYYPDAAAFLQAHPHRPGTLVFTNGCFDLIHPGHVQYLEDARALGDFLVLGLNSDASVARLKGPSRPLQDETARYLIPLVEVVKSDYTLDTVVGREVVEARGGKVVLIPFLPGHSTSTIVGRILSGRGVLA